MDEPEPEPEYQWVMVGFHHEIFTDHGKVHYRQSDDPYPGASELTDEVLEQSGCIRIETLKSRLARAMWRIRQLELRWDTSVKMRSGQDERDGEGTQPGSDDVEPGRHVCGCYTEQDGS